MVAHVNTSNGPTRSRAWTPGYPRITTDRTNSVFALPAVASRPWSPQIRTRRQSFLRHSDRAEAGAASVCVGSRASGDDHVHQSHAKSGHTCSLPSPSAAAVSRRLFQFQPVALPYAVDPPLP